MINKLLKKTSAKFQIALGLCGILVTLMLVAGMTGLVPDRHGAIRDGHASLAEAIAVNSSIYITQSDLRRLEAVLDVTVKRNEDLLSAAIRQNDGKPMVVIGDHVSSWKKLDQGQSTDTQVVVPIFEGKKIWGQVELRFASILPEGWIGKIYSPVLLLVGVISFTCFAFFYLYLGKMLKHLDPSQAIPDRVRSALDTMAEGLLVLDAKQNIVLANQSFSELVKMDSKNLMGFQATRFSWKTADDQDVEVHSSPWGKTLEDGETRTAQIIHLHMPDEERKTFMVNCSPVLSSGSKPAGVMVSFDDVTELQQKELELRLSKEEAEAANRSKSDFLANMSHEIRTPMNAILGFAEVLKRGHNKNTDENLKYLNTITTSGNHLLNLINDILDLSKVEAGHIEIELLDTPVHQVIHEVVQIMKVKADEKGIFLKYEPSGPLPAYINTDPGKIRQIITNLIGNAIKFTESGGVTIVSELEGKGKSSVLKLAVIDTGIGMTKSQADAIFNPFSQADSSITRRFGGTGLGLTISQRFSQELGGDIVVTSEEGKGSTFTATIATPIADNIEWLSVEDINSAHWVTEHQQQQSWKFPESNILVVDDGAENRELLEVVLGDLGLNVATAENGQLGLDQMNLKSFAVVLMDVQMPVMDGYTAVRLMREQGFKTPIIALTADAMKGTEESCLEAGYSGYMTKPVNIDKLTELLAKEIGGEPVTEEEVKSIPQPVESGVTLADTSKAAIKSTLPLNNPRYRGIVEKFVIRLEERLEEVESAWQQKNYLELAKLGHWLKGSGGTVGFDQFTEPASELEIYAKQQNDEKISTTIEALNDLFTRIDLGQSDASNVPKEQDSEQHMLKKTYVIPEQLKSRLPDTHPKFRPIIEKFITQLGDHSKQLKQSIEAEDFEEIEKIAYWIKAAAGSVGFDAFTEPAEDLEVAAKQRDLSVIKAATDAICKMQHRISLTETA